MFELHPDAILIYCSLLSSMLFVAYEIKVYKEFYGEYPSSLFCRILAGVIVVLVLITEFRTLTWGKAIIDFLIAAAVTTGIALLVGRFLDRLNLFFFSVLGMFAALIFLIINLF